MLVKYHLGCGGDIKQGYINVDAYNRSANIICDLITHKMSKCDLIESHHVFEHFGYVDSMFLIIKWTLSLNVGGKLVIDVPDVQRIVACSAGNIQKERAAMRLLYGSQEDKRWAYHINGWTPELLKETLKTMGYVDIEFDRYGNPDSDFPNVGFFVSGIKGSFVPRKELRNRAELILRDYVHYPSETYLYDRFKRELRERIMDYVNG